jgi:hypothetical protein
MLESLKVRAICREQGLDSRLNDLYVTIYNSLKDPLLEREYLEHDYFGLPYSVQSFFTNKSFNDEQTKIYFKMIQPNLSGMSIKHSVSILVGAGIKSFLQSYSTLDSKL